MKRKFLILLSLFLFVVALNLAAKSTLFTLVTDMFNQVSLKPQERGSMRTFPIGTVSVDGRVNEDPADRFSWMEKEILNETATKNPTTPGPESIANGKLKYNTYCLVCHGDTTAINKAGFAATKINDLGMIAPAVIKLTPFFSDGYIFHKAKYGGAVMPALGYATTATDRWDIVNYIRTLEKAP